MNETRKPQNGDLVCCKGENMVVIYHDDVWWDSNELQNYYLIKETEIKKLKKTEDLDELKHRCSRVERWGECYGKKYRPFYVIEENKYEVDIKTITTVNIKQTKKDAIN